MKTAEEILKSKIDELSQHSNYQPYKYWDSSIKDAVIEAMEEYAKKEAIEFSIFCLDYDIKNKAHELSTKELYEIFKNQ